MYVFVVSFLMYLLLVWSGGPVGKVELAIALFISVIITIAFRTWHPEKKLSFRGLNPLKWAGFVWYLFGPFAVALAKANIDVATRVITGKIRPGIVRVKPELKTDLARTMLADSITLTPGTLTVDVDDEGFFYIHWIYVQNESPSGEDLYGNFEDWARRLAE